MATDRHSRLHGVWRFFISIRLTIALLILLSIVCVIGTVIPQNASTHDYIRMYGETTFRILKAAGMLDLFHAWWFVALMVLFACNLIACSINRLPALLRAGRQKSVPSPDSLQSMKHSASWRFKQFDETGMQRCSDAVAAFLARPVKTVQDGVTCLAAEKGIYSRYAFYLTHIGVLVILAGAVMGSFGFKGYMQLFEGERSDTAILRSSRSAEKLDFTIRCDSFDVEFYDKKGMPKDYKSTLTVIENGAEVLTKVIEVNDPLIYRGIYFYQSSYGTASDRADVKIGVTPRGPGPSETYEVSTGGSFVIGESGDTVTVGRFIPDFTMNSAGKIISRSNQPNNPAVQLRIEPAVGDPYSAWIFARFPSFHKKPDQPYDFSLQAYQLKFYTGLEVTRDPGVWVVWAGCIIMVIGIYTAFFVSHRRAWLVISRQDDACRVVLAGSSSKNSLEFGREFDKLCDTIQSIGKG